MKDKFLYALMLLAMIVPPYNIICWAAGYAVYLVQGGGQGSGDFLYGVLCAPIFLPLYGFVSLKERLTSRPV